MRGYAFVTNKQTKHAHTCAKGLPDNDTRHISGGGCWLFVGIGYRFIGGMSTGIGYLLVVT